MEQGEQAMIFHESRDNGWVQYRRNLVAHVEDGRMDGHDFMVLSMLLLLADSDNGTVKTCASALTKLLHCGLDERNIQKILDRLDKRDYIRRIIVTGRRGLYLVTINKYAITTGHDIGKRSSITARTESKPAFERGTEAGLNRDPSGTHVVSEVGVKQGQAIDSESAGSSVLGTVAGTEAGLNRNRSGTHVVSDPSAIQQRYRRKTKTQEKETAVVGVGKAPKVEGDEDVPFHFSGTVEKPDGTDVGGDPESDVGTMNTVPGEVDRDPGKQREGDTGTTGISGGGPLEGQYVPGHREGEGGMAAEGAAAAPAAPARRPRAKDSPSIELARFYFERLGSPPELKGRIRAWVQEAAELLKTYPPADIYSAATYALNHQFWRPKMLRFGPTDPFTYFALKLPELIAQFRAAERGAVLKPDPKRSEPPHGKNPTARKSKQQLVDDANQQGADKILRELRGLP
jgi:hypothetical protein